MGGSAYLDSFRYSADPLWRKAWDTRISSYAESFPGHRLGPDGTLAAIIADEDLVLYDNYFSVREQQQPGLIHFLVWTLVF